MKTHPSAPHPPDEHSSAAEPVGATGAADAALSRFNAAKHAALPIFAELAEAAARLWGMEPQVVFLTLLQLAASAAGRQHRLRHGAFGITCPFSLIVLSAEKSRHRFAECLADPWLVRLRALATEAASYSAGELERFVFQLKKDVSRPGSCPFPTGETAYERYLRVARLLKPNLVIRSPLPAVIAKAIATSCDRAVLSMDGGIDPLAELWSAGAGQVMRMCSLLSASWEGIEVGTDARASEPLAASLLWRTHRDAASRLLFDQSSPWRTAAPPVILIQQKSPPGFLEDLPADLMTRWEAILVGLFERRHIPQAITDWAMTPEAFLQWRDFDRQVRSTMVPGTIPLRYYAWMPELMLRLALLYSVLEWEGSRRAVAPTVCGRAVEHAKDVAWWILEEHIKSLNALSTPTRTQP